MSRAFQKRGPGLHSSGAGGQLRCSSAGSLEEAPACWSCPFSGMRGLPRSPCPPHPLHLALETVTGPGAQRRSQKCCRGLRCTRPWPRGAPQAEAGTCAAEGHGVHTVEASAVPHAPAAPGAHPSSRRGAVGPRSPRFWKARGTQAVAPCPHVPVSPPATGALFQPRSSEWWLSWSEALGLRAGLKASPRALVGGGAGAGLGPFSNSFNGNRIWGVVKCMSVACPLSRVPHRHPRCVRFIDRWL